MDNVGEWNSNLALFYLFLFTIPIILLFAKWVVEAFHDTTHYVHVPVEIEKPIYRTIEKPIYRTKTVYKDRIVYRDRPVLKVQPKPQPEPANNNNQMIDEVAVSLCSLGFNKRHAKALASNLADQKQYANAESLLRDCLARL